MTEAHYPAPQPPHPEPVRASQLGEQSNKIRAAVLGANDGIVSVAGLVLGVAGATASTAAILTAGVAGLVAGALSMAAGEYVSVSSQRDTERAAVTKESAELKADPESEFEELVYMYRLQGFSEPTARAAATDMTAKDPLAAHVRAEFGLELGEYVNPWSAAIFSLFSFTIGALLPVLAMAFLPVGIRVPATFVAVVIALAITGYVSAHLVGANEWRAIVRNITGGAIAMAVTFGIGALVGTNV